MQKKIGTIELDVFQMEDGTLEVAKAEKEIVGPPPIRYPRHLSIGTYPTNAVHFDGSTYLNRGADLTGNADGKQGILSVWLKLDGDTSGDDYVWDSGSNRFRFIWLADETFQVRGANVSNVEILNMVTSTITATSSGGWFHILASWDLSSAGSGRLYVNDVDDKTENTYTNDSIDYTRTDHRIGGIGTNFFSGCMSELYVNFAEYLDFDTESNRRKFISSSGKPVSLGSDGSAPTGSQPIVYLKNSLSTFPTNLGSGGDFSVTAGSLTSCASTPSD